MSGDGRPSVDVQVQLHAAEWRELHREALRLEGFWPRTAVVGVVIVAAALTAIVLDAPTRPTLGLALIALAAVLAYVIGYVWAGPRLRWARVPAEQRTSRWRVCAERIATDSGGSRLELVWHDVDRVVITRRLLVVQLGGRDGTLGLPRREATSLGESLIVGWARDSGAEVIHRRSAFAAPGDAQLSLT